jgi:hypothetical protein
MNQDEIITNSPYNTLNLPQNKNPNLKNPRQSHRVELGIENEFYDPTAKMVNQYMKDNISMYDNRGKYFDTYLFNQRFDQYIREKNAERILKEKVKLYDLDQIENIEIAPYQLPIDKLLINFKNIWFNFFDNVIRLKNPFENITTNDLFYYGITFIVIFIMYIMLSYIFT